MSNAVIFNGDYLKALKSKLKLAETAYIETGTADPTTLSLTSPVGSLYLRSNGTLYVKYAVGASSWAPALLTGTGGTLTNTALNDSSVYFVDNTDNTKKMYFELSGILTGQTRTLTIPNLSGTLPVGTGTANHVAYWSGTNQIAGEAQLASSRGGTGINNAGTLTYGTNNITFTTTAVTSLTLPTSGTLATLAGAEALTNKTINSSSIGSTTASSGAFTFLTLRGTGTAGTAYFDLLQETSAPSSPASGYSRLYATSDVLNLKNSINEVFAIDYSGITTSRTLTVPDRSSTIATLDGNQTFTGILSLSTSNLVSLAITGGLKVGNVTSTASSAGAGAIKYTTGFLYYSDGTNWTALASYANSIYQNSSFLAAINTDYFVDTTSGVVTATLPTGSSNAKIKFIDVKEKWGLNNFTITPAAGEKIDNLTTNESLVMDINGSWIELAWDTTTSSWVIAGSLSYGSSPTGFVTHTGNSLGVDLLIGTNDNYALAFETNAIERMRLDTSGRLLIGHNQPILVGSATNYRPLQTIGTSFATTGWASAAFSTSAYPSFLFGKSRGATIGDYTATQNNDFLGEFVFAGSDGTDIATQAGRMSVAVDGTVAADSVPGRIMFFTRPEGDSGTSLPERMRITNAGRIGINTTDPRALVDINGGMRVAYDAYAINTNLTIANHFVVATASINLTLPTLTASDDGFTLYIKRVTTAGVVTINPGAGVTIDGNTTWPLTSNYESVKLVWRGSSDWSIF